MPAAMINNGHNTIIWFYVYITDHRIPNTVTSNIEMACTVWNKKWTLPFSQKGIYVDNDNVFRRPMVINLEATVSKGDQYW